MPGWLWRHCVRGNDSLRISGSCRLLIEPPNVRRGSWLCENAGLSVAGQVRRSDQALFGCLERIAGFGARIDPMAATGWFERPLSGSASAMGVVDWKSATLSRRHPAGRRRVGNNLSARRHSLHPYINYIDRRLSICANNRPDGVPCGYPVGLSACNGYISATQILPHTYLSHTRRIPPAYPFHAPFLHGIYTKAAGTGPHGANSARKLPFCHLFRSVGGRATFIGSGRSGWSRPACRPPGSGG